MSVSKTFKTYTAALAVAEEADRALRERKRKAEAEFEEQWEKTTEADRERLYQLRREANDAKEAWEAAKVERAAQDTNAIALGTVMVEWKRSGYGFSPGPMKPTGRRGRVAIWTRESPHPENIRWGLPDVGDRYIRVLKKDGTESINFEKLSDWKTTWKPEGEEPEEKKGRSRF